MSIFAQATVYHPDYGLKIHRFMPKQPNGMSILFFHGGAFLRGHPRQFFPHCRALAQQGIIAGSAEYRRIGQQGATAIHDCMADALTAWLWWRGQVVEWGGTPGRATLAGGSAGGHLALTTLTHQENTATHPNALILFNPALAGAGIPNDIAPLHHLKPHLPPTLIFHGTADQIIPHTLAQQFQQTMQTLDNSCQLVTFEGYEHGFFNYGKHNNQPYQTTIETTIAFLKNQLAASR